MKIGILTNTYPPNLNGVSVTTAQLVEDLKAKGIEVFVAAPEVAGVDYPDYILPLPSFPLPKQFSSDLRVPLFYSAKVADFFRDSEVELIHSQDTFFGGIEAADIALDLGIPCIHTYHTYIENYKHVDVPGYISFIRRFTQNVCNRYDHVITLSSKIHSYLSSLEITAPSSQFLNVTNLNHLDSHKTNQLLAQSYGIEEDDFAIITFGRVAPEKGLETALEVVAPLLKSHRNIKYIIAGQGIYQKKLKNKAARLGIANQVVFAGKYTPETLSNLCSLAKFFLFTSTSENLPTTILEAMYCGLPVVAIDDESVDYILYHKVNGIKVAQEELSHACGDLYSNPQLLQSLSEQAIISANKIKQKDVVQDYINLYTSVIAQYEPTVRPKFFQKYFSEFGPNDLETYNTRWSNLWK